VVVVVVDSAPERVARVAQGALASRASSHSTTSRATKMPKLSEVAIGIQNGAAVTPPRTLIFLTV